MMLLICQISIICMFEMKTETTDRRALIRCMNILYNCCSFASAVSTSVCLCAHICSHVQARLREAELGLIFSQQRPRGQCQSTVLSFNVGVGL